MPEYDYFDEELLETIQQSLPPHRERGEGITGDELADATDLSGRQATYRLNRRVERGELTKVKMIDFDGNKRNVYKGGDQ